MSAFERYCYIQISALCVQSINVFKGVTGEEVLPELGWAAGLGKTAGVAQHLCRRLSHLGFAVLSGHPFVRLSRLTALRKESEQIVSLHLMVIKRTASALPTSLPPKNTEINQKHLEFIGKQYNWPQRSFHTNLLFHNRKDNPSD